jgi:hypothetical protein
MGDWARKGEQMLVEEIKKAFRKRNKLQWKQKEVAENFIEALIASEVAHERGLKITLIWSAKEPTEERIKAILAGAPPTRAEEGFGFC